MKYPSCVTSRERTTSSAGVRERMWIDESTQHFYSSHERGPMRPPPPSPLLIRPSPSSSPNPPSHPLCFKVNDEEETKDEYGGRKEGGEVDHDAAMQRAARKSVAEGKESSCNGAGGPAQAQRRRVMRPWRGVVHTRSGRVKWRPACGHVVVDDRL